MKSIILRQSAKSFFKTSSEIENRIPNGEWRYFKFISKKEVLGIYQNDLEGRDLHPDFFKYFLGQFSPTLNKTFSIQESENFEAFCDTLNALLYENVQIFDLSVTNFWIWSDQKNEVLEVPKKLKAYLSFC